MVNVMMQMEKLVSLCKRRGFMFQSSEIYGGLNGFWDYGPLGVELKKNIKEAWWRDMVTGHNELSIVRELPANMKWWDSIAPSSCIHKFGSAVGIMTSSMTLWSIAANQTSLSFDQVVDVG